MGFFILPKSFPLHHNFSLFFNLRWSLNHFNPNRLLTSPENYHQTLSPLHHNPSSHNKLGDWDLRLGDGSGYRIGSGSGFGLGEPGLNPVLRLGLSPPNPTENTNSPGSEDTDPNEPMSDDGGVGKGVEKSVEVSEKKVGGKGKSNISVWGFQEKKGSGSDSGYAINEEQELNFVKTYNQIDILSHKSTTSERNGEREE